MPNGCESPVANTSTVTARPLADSDAVLHDPAKVPRLDPFGPLASQRVPLKVSRPHLHTGRSPRLVLFGTRLYRSRKRSGLQTRPRLGSADRFWAALTTSEAIACSTNGAAHPIPNASEG